jgi:hypothetical protein
MKKQYYTKQQILEDKQPLNEEGWFTIENTLMALGFVPVIGEVADFALIIYYLKKGQNIYAALMCIALFPVVGDLLVKPFIKLLKLGKGGTVALKGGVEMTEYLSKNPKMAAKAAEIAKHATSPTAEKVVASVANINKGWGSGLKGALAELGGIFAKIKPVGAIGAGLSAKVAGSTFKTGLKGYYQGERIAQYAIKNGMKPEGFVKNWYIPYVSRLDRKNSFRKFIIANNLLAKFGIPSLTTFEEKVMSDERFREKLANDPAMSEYIATNSTSENAAQSTNKTDGSDGVGNKALDLMGGTVGLGIIKRIASTIA